MINKAKFIDTHVDPEIHKSKEAQQLKQSCQQFESILWANSGRICVNLQCP